MNGWVSHCLSRDRSTTFEGTSIVFGIDIQGSSAFHLHRCIIFHARWHSNLILQPNFPATLFIRSIGRNVPVTRHSIELTEIYWLLKCFFLAFSGSQSARRPCLTMTITPARHWPGIALIFKSRHPRRYDELRIIFVRMSRGSAAGSLETCCLSVIRERSFCVFATQTHMKWVVIRDYR